MDELRWHVMLTLDEARRYIPDISKDVVFPIVVLIFENNQAYIMDRNTALSIYQSYISQLALYHDIGTGQNTLLLPPQELNND